MYDVKIAGGTIIDGTGRERFRGDIGIINGKIRDVGPSIGEAVETIDATGRIVAPGFVDIHTHLDAQILWDKSLSFSPWHGVTTVVMGNCGFSVAPTLTQHRETILRTLENVEGMPFDALQAGLGDDWGFETFPEYLDLIDGPGARINFGVLFGHTPTRYMAMGVDAALSRAATEDEVAEIARLVREAMDAGALGVSTSRASAHAGFNGLPVPSRLAEAAEINAMVDAMAEGGYGVFQATTGPGLGPRELGEINRRTGRPVTFVGIITDLGGPGGHRKVLERLEEVRANGSDIVAQVSCRPLVQGFTFVHPYPLAVAAPATLWLPLVQEVFQPAMDATTIDDKIREYQRPEFLKAFEEGTSSQDWYDRIWSKVVTLDMPGLPEQFQSRPLVEIAEELGRSPASTCWYLALETGLVGRFAVGHLNADLDEVEILLKHEGTQVGLSDAGAHLSEICDACFPTDLLGRWVRERGSLGLEEAVAMLTSRGAALMGITDRGRLEVGLAADVVVFDPDVVAAGQPMLVSDLPGGHPRLVAPAHGIDLVMVNGTVIRQAGRDTDLGDGELPGRLLRGGRART